jgi:dehydrogenase/reductase SDR family protein 1
MHTKFYDLPEEIFDQGIQKFLTLTIYFPVNNVGLRGHYICARHAAKLMAPRKQGLIVTVSSFGGVSYVFNVAYGIGKAGVCFGFKGCLKRF